MSELDLNDPAVRQMVERNHVPEEVWTVAGALVSVHCEQCGNQWPCPTVERLRAVMAARWASATEGAQP